MMNNCYCAVLISVLLLFVGCNKWEMEDVYFDTSYSDKVISFRNNGASFTKAYSDNTEGSIRVNGFGVACITENGVSVFNEKAVWDNSMSVYRPVSRLYYFPMSETISFYAVYPFSQPIKVSDAKASLLFTQQPDLDLLASVKKDVAKTENSVPLEFNHILSLVKFYATGTDGNVVYILKSISLSVPSGGEFRYSSFDWESDEISNEAFYSGSIVLDGVTSVPGAMTFVPCEPVLHVEWDTYDLDGKTLIASNSENKSLGRPIRNGEECTVTLKLSNTQAESLAFEVIVSPWSETNKSIELN